MSLSKYYKNTGGFQQEKLVKEEVTKDKGWKPLPGRPGTGFIPQPIQHQIKPPAPSPVPQQEDVSGQPPEQEIAPQEMVDFHQRTPDSSQPSIQEAAEVELPPPADLLQQDIPSPPEVDLSRYIEIAEAQNQMEAAYQEGIQTGIKQAEEDYGSATKALLNLCTQLNTLQETIIKNSSGELQDFALAIADRILRFSIAQQDSTIIATIEEALQRAIRSEEFTIYLHPDDLEIVQEKSAEIVANISGLDNIVLKKDPAIERGGAKLESENCTIDATIVSQFELIRDEVLKKQ